MIDFKMRVDYIILVVPLRNDGLCCGALWKYLILIAALSGE
jgi:hypothetical protein